MGGETTAKIEGGWGRDRAKSVQKFQKTEISGINRPKVLKSELFGSK